MGAGASCNRGSVMIHDNMVVMQTSCDVSRDVHSERNGTLWLKCLINVAVRNPDRFAARVVENCEDLCNIDDLAALIHQGALEYRPAESIFADRLILDGNDRVGASRYEQWVCIDPHTLYLTQLGARK